MTTSTLILCKQGGFSDYMQLAYKPSKYGIHKKEIG